jgi:uncharacterized protein with von Willebrand factor type A (vWA) domain
MTNQPQTTPANQFMLAIAGLRCVLEANTASEIVADMTSQIFERILADMEACLERLRNIDRSMEDTHATRETENESSGAGDSCVQRLVSVE